MDIRMDNMAVPCLDSQKKLYEKSLNFILKESSSSLSRDTTRLWLSVEWQNTASGLHNKELFISLTDPLDPFFLYTLRLGGDDFLNLKHQQGLLVDFMAFPQSFINFLEQCLQEENKMEPKYLLYLNIGSSGIAQLDIVETNLFKLITHLSLKLATPTDFMVKQYLTTCFKNLKEEKEKIENKVVFLQQELKKQVDRIRDLTSDKNHSFEQLQMEQKTAINSMERKFEEQIKVEKNKALEVLSSERRRYKTDMSNMEHNNRHNIKNLESKISDLERENEEYKEKINRLEQVESDLQSSVKTLNNEIKDTRNSLEIYTKKSRELETELGEVRPELDTLKRMKVRLEGEICSQDERFSEMENKLTSIIKERNSLADHLTKIEAQLLETQENERCLVNDIGKANDIIRKMQAEARMFHEKLKTKGKMEDVLKKQQETIKSLKNDLFSASSLLKNQQEELDLLRKTVKNLQKKLVDTENKLHSKEEIIKLIDQQFSAESDQASSRNSAVESNAGTEAVCEDEELMLHTNPNCGFENDPYEVGPSNLQNNPRLTNPQLQRTVRLEPRYSEKHPNFIASRQQQIEENGDHNYIQEIYRRGNNNQKPSGSQAHPNSRLNHRQDKRQ